MRSSRAVHSHSVVLVKSSSHILHYHRLMRHSPPSISSHLVSSLRRYTYIHIPPSISVFQYFSISASQYLSSELLLLPSRLRLRLLFLACALPVRAPMTAPPSVPTPGPSKTSPSRPPAPAPRKLSRDSWDFFLECFWWWWCLWGRSS